MAGQYTLTLFAPGAPTVVVGVPNVPIAASVVVYLFAPVGGYVVNLGSQSAPALTFAPVFSQFLRQAYLHT